MREQLADQGPVVGRVEPAVDCLVDPAQQRGLGHAQRRVGALGLQVQLEPVEPERGAEALPEQGPRPARRRHRHQVDPLGGQVVAPPVEDVGHLLHAPEPGGDAALAPRVLHLLEEAGVADRPAVLDVLLPLGGDLADQVAHREDDMDLGAVVVAQRLERAPDLGPGGGREDLVADDRGVLPAAHLLGQPVPGPDRLALQAAPRQPHQVERREELVVEPLGGIEDPVLGEDPLVAEQHVLQVRRPGLGGADVQEDPLGHSSSPRGRGCCLARRRPRSAAPRPRAAAGAPAPARPRRTARPRRDASGATAGRGRRAQRIQRRADPHASPPPGRPATRGAPGVRRPARRPAWPAGAEGPAAAAPRAGGGRRGGRAPRRPGGPGRRRRRRPARGARRDAGPPRGREGLSGRGRPPPDDRTGPTRSGRCGAGRPAAAACRGARASPASGSRPRHPRRSSGAPTRRPASGSGPCRGRARGRRGRRADDHGPPARVATARSAPGRRAAGSAGARAAPSPGRPPAPGRWRRRPRRSGRLPPGAARHRAGAPGRPGAGRSGGARRSPRARGRVGRGPAPRLPPPARPAWARGHRRR